MKLFKLLDKKKLHPSKSVISSNKLFGASLLLAASGTALIFINWKKLPPELPLHYSRPWGETQLASLHSFFLLPLLGTSLCLINFFLAKTLFRQNAFLTKVLEITSLFLNALLLITIIKIISIIL